MSKFVRNVLAEQRKRLVATLMTYVEANVYPALDARQQRALRERIITAVSQYHDTCLDMVKASVDDGSVINEEALRILADVHAALRKTHG